VVSSSLLLLLSEGRKFKMLGRGVDVVCCSKAEPKLE
jgi:hypothetical protein